MNTRVWSTETEPALTQVLMLSITNYRSIFKESLLCPYIPHLKRAGYKDMYDKSPVISGQHRVFTIPTILLFFEGREHLRFSRNISLHQLEETIEKPYGLVFEE